MTAATLLGYALALYVLAGLCTALAFVTFGVGRVLSHPNAFPGRYFAEQTSLPVSFTLGARLLILPGAAALWPYVLARWLKARHG